MAKIAVLGFGTVGGGVARVLEEDRAAIAARLETAGKAAMLLLAMPVFSELLQQALRLIGT